jgi:hypothetical protein
MIVIEESAFALLRTAFAEVRSWLWRRGQQAAYLTMASCLISMNNERMVGLVKHSSPMIVAKLHTMLDNAWMSKGWKGRIARKLSVPPRFLTKTVSKAVKDLQNLVTQLKFAITTS